MTPRPEQPARCAYRAGWCEKDAGHDDDHYTTYRDGEVWTREAAAAALPDVAELATAMRAAAETTDMDDPTTVGRDKHLEWAADILAELRARR